MSRTYAEILAAANARLLESVAEENPRFLYRVLESVVTSEVDRDLFLGPETVLGFLNANPDVLRWVSTTTDEPIWLVVKDTVRERLAEDLQDAVAAYRLECIGSVGDLISRMIDFSSHVALDVMPEALPGYFDLDMGWTLDVGSTRRDDVQSVVLGALGIVEALQPLSQGDFNSAILDSPWKEDAPSLLRDMELFRLAVANDPKPVYASLQKHGVTRQHSYGKVLAR
jgi:hypothetical protein